MDYSTDKETRNIKDPDDDEDLRRFLRGGFGAKWAEEWPWICLWIFQPVSDISKYIFLNESRSFNRLYSSAEQFFGSSPTDPAAEYSIAVINKRNASI